MTAGVVSGRCYGVGVGPGDPELMTIKAMRILRSSPVVAYFSAAGRNSNARHVVSEFLTDAQVELHLIYPVTTEDLPKGQDYEALMAEFYDESADRVRMAAEACAAARNAGIELISDF